MGHTPTTAQPGRRARHVATDVPAKRPRRGGRGTPAEPPRAGRRRSPEPDASLRADALTAANILAAHSEFWAAEQILLHPEIAKIAATEARTALAAAARGPRKRRSDARTALAELDAAVDVLTAAQEADVVEVLS